MEKANARNSHLPPTALGIAASDALKCNKVPLQVSHSAEFVKIPDDRKREREKERGQLFAAAPRTLPEVDFIHRRLT